MAVLYRVQVSDALPHGARTPGILFGCPSPRQAADWSSLFRGDIREHIFPVVEVTIPDDTPICYSVGDEALVELPMWIEHQYGAQNRGIVSDRHFARWGFARDINPDVYEIRVEVGEIRFPERIVGYVTGENHRDGIRVVFLGEDNVMWSIADWNAFDAFSHYIIR